MAYLGNPFNVTAWSLMTGTSTIWLQIARFLLCTRCTLTLLAAIWIALSEHCQLLRWLPLDAPDLKMPGIIPHPARITVSSFRRHAYTPRHAAWAQVWRLRAHPGEIVTPPAPGPSNQETRPTPKMKLGNLLSANESSRIAIGGHRGCGENLLAGILSAPDARVEPAVRENTIASFKRAVALGVSFIEFDVQVTKDGIPVIWHDDQIITRGPGVPPSHSAVKDHSLSDFMSLVRQLDSSTWTTEVVRTFRSRETRQATEGLTPWQCSQDDRLPTLQQVFKELPEHVGFDVEVKMTVPDDIPVTSAEEIERVVGPIVRTVEECSAGSSRTIMYSSFDPDVCVKLRQVQNKYPVMFLSCCGLYRHVDRRRTSIAAALEFATQQNLAGVVVPTSVLMGNPELVQSATAQGLKVLTYGLENDDIYAVEMQMKLGVHAAIVDDVEATLPRLVANQAVDAEA